MTDNEILMKILEKVDSLEASQKEIKDNQSEMNTQLQKLRSSVDQDVNRKLDLLMGQHGELIAAQKVTSDYPETKGRVATLEQVVRDHTKDITELKEKAM